MKSALLDTSLYSAFKAGSTEAIDAMRRPETILVCPTVLGEILSGFKCGSRERENRDDLDLFLDSPRVTTVTSDKTTSEYYAQIYHALRRKGTPIPTNDMWIAASALQHSAAVYTYDSHFSHIDGLIVEQLQG